MGVGAQSSFWGQSMSLEVGSYFPHAMEGGGNRATLEEVSHHQYTQAEPHCSDVDEAERQFKKKTKELGLPLFQVSETKIPPKTQAVPQSQGT